MEQTKQMDPISKVTLKKFLNAILLTNYLEHFKMKPITAGFSDEQKEIH